MKGNPELIHKMRRSKKKDNLEDQVYHPNNYVKTNPYSFSDNGLPSIVQQRQHQQQLQQQVFTTPSVVGRLQPYSHEQQGEQIYLHQSLQQYPILDNHGQNNRVQHYSEEAMLRQRAVLGNNYSSSNIYTGAINSEVGQQFLPQISLPTLHVPDSNSTSAFTSAPYAFLPAQQQGHHIENIANQSRQNNQMFPQLQLTGTPNCPSRSTDLQYIQDLQQKGQQSMHFARRSDR